MRTDKMQKVKKKDGGPAGWNQTVFIGRADAEIGDGTCSVGLIIIAGEVIKDLIKQGQVW